MVDIHSWLLPTLEVEECICGLSELFNSNDGGGKNGGTTGINFSLGSLDVGDANDYKAGGKRIC